MIQGHIVSVVLTALVVWSLHVHLVYRLPSRVLVAVVPWLGVALAIVTPLIVINRLVSRLEPVRLALVARITLALSVLAALLLFFSITHPGLRWVVPAVITLAATVAAMLLVVLAGDLFIRVGPPELARTLRWLEQGVSVLVGGFVLLAVAAFANGQADTGPIQEVNAEIENTGPMMVTLEGVLEMGWADVRHAAGGRVDRVLLTAVERRTFFPGKPVVLRMRPGALGVPWISDIWQDEDARARQAIAHAPDARLPRSALIDGALRRRDWETVRVLALDYLERFPDQREASLVFKVVNDLGIAHQNSAALSVVQALAAKHPTPENLSLAGLIYHVNGNNERARELLEAAVAKEADGLTVYRLGLVYEALGRVDEAIETFDRAQTLLPHLLEIKKRRDALQHAKTVRAKRMPPGD